MHRRTYEEDLGHYHTRAYCRRVMLGVLYDLQKGRCSRCGHQMDPVRTAKVQSNRNRPTRDHVLPQALGGPDAPGNLLAAHARCNSEKGDTWPTDIELEVLDRVNREMRWPTPAKLRRVA